MSSLPLFFFSDNVDEDGIKVKGLYPYHVYVQIIADLLGHEPKRAAAITIEQFLKRYAVVASIEVAVVFNLSVEEAEKQLKVLRLQQKVESIPVKYGTFWRYIEA